MSSEYWNEQLVIIITQVCCGSVSLVVSTAIVTFIYRKGLRNSPYRRIIFGLSLSDILRSLAIVAGPWLIYYSDGHVPHSQSQPYSYAQLGIGIIGNKHTCRLDGFLFLMGATSAPMYTLCLYIYYVCKLTTTHSRTRRGRTRMTDEQFTHRIEKRMHVIVVAINLGLHLTELGMDTIHPAPAAAGGSGGPNGYGNLSMSICLPNPNPRPGQQQQENYEDFSFEDSDHATSTSTTTTFNKAALFFMITNSAFVPVACLIGTVTCLALIYRNVLMRERLFGIRRRRWGGQLMVRDTDADAAIATTRRVSTLRRQRRDRYEYEYEYVMSSIYSSDLTPSVRVGRDQDEIEYSNAKTQDLERAIISCHTTDLRSRCCGFSCGCVRVRENDTVDEDCRCRAPDQEENVNENANASENILHELETTSEKNTRVASLNAPDNNHRLAEAGGDGDGGGGDTIESLSSLFKRELLSQACAYILLLCLNLLPLVTIHMKADMDGGGDIHHREPSSSHSLFHVANLSIIIGLYSLGGLFNAIIYTRPNVTSFRRNHPACPRWRAFWLVLKAGGETPNEDEWDDDDDATSLTTWNIRGYFCRLIKRTKHGNGKDQEDPERIVGGAAGSSSSGEEVISNIQFGMITPVTPSLPNSALAMDGMSKSFDSANAAYRSIGEWNHQEGGRSLSGGTASIPNSKIEIGSSRDRNVDSTTCTRTCSGGVGTKRTHSNINLPSHSNSGLKGHRRGTEEDEDDDIWIATLERRKRWEPSE